MLKNIVRRLKAFLKDKQPEDIINPDSMWLTMYGNKLRVRDMHNKHVANIINYMPTSWHRYNWWYSKMLDGFKKEAGRRGLSEDFLKKAPYSYPNPITGKIIVRSPKEAWR